MRTFLKIFLINFILLVILFIFIFARIDKITKNAFKNETLNDLRSKWVLLENYNLPDNFDKSCCETLKKISQKTKLRITLIKKNGKVIYDSFLSPERILKMDNHKDRPEVKNAIFSEKHEGYSIRFSKTLQLYMFYYAKPLNNNIVLRIAYPMDYLKQFQEEYINDIGKSFVYLTILCFFLSFIIAYLFSIPVKKLETLANQIEKGEEEIVFPEFKNETFKRIGDVVYKIYNSMKQKQMNLMLEKSKSEFIFSILDEGIILFNIKNEILYFNNKAEELLSIKLEKRKNIFKLPGLDYNVTNFLRVINNENGYFTEKLNEKTIEIYIKKIENEKLVVFSDISKKIEYREFKHQLIGNISHELKTPIATIMNAAETILNYPNLTKEELQNFIKIIYRNSSKMGELIHDIIELHQLENIGNLEVTETANIDEIIAEILTIYKEQEKNLIINSNVKSINILPQHFQSLIINLVDNALKYSHGKNIYVSIEKSNNKVILKVEDEGPLIPAEDRERIFERFYTVSKSRNKDKSGSGLGLSIVKHIAKIYNGKVKLEPNKYGGNSFIVEIKC